MEYILITTDSSDDMVDQVNKHIKSGFKPLGGVAIGTINKMVMAPMGQMEIKKNVIMQSMIKE